MPFTGWEADPEEPGLYWYWSADMRAWTVVDVQWVKADDGQELLGAFALGQMGAYDVAAMQPLWGGPVTMPEPVPVDVQPGTRVN